MTAAARKLPDSVASEVLLATLRVSIARALVVDPSGTTALMRRALINLGGVVSVEEFTRDPSAVIARAFEQGHADVVGAEPRDHIRFSTQRDDLEPERASVNHWQVRAAARGRSVTAHAFPVTTEYPAVVALCNGMRRGLEPFRDAVRDDPSCKTCLRRAFGRRL